MENVVNFEGQLLGNRYRVGPLLGVGGSASVYTAEDTSFGREVAVKIPHDNVRPNSLVAKRLVREARASGAVGHPNVCQISEIGELANGCPYIVMERLAGETLRDRISKTSRLSFGDAIDIMTQLLSGLSAAHDRGIIHRDIKPENIFLARRVGCAPLVKILDFGLVSTERLAAEELTTTGVVVGTPHYVAPEHIRGLRDIDPRSDIYSCGVVLYEITTGKRPFSARNSTDLFREIMTGAVPSITDLRRETPPELVRCIQKAMARAPGDRFPQATAFQSALARVNVGPSSRVEHEEADDDSLTVNVRFDSPRSTAAPRVEASPAAIQIAVPFSIEDEGDDQPTQWDQVTTKQSLESPKK